MAVFLYLNFHPAFSRKMPYILHYMKWIGPLMVYFLYKYILTIDKNERYATKEFETDLCVKGD